jgi:hypothetical protein
MNGDRNQAWLQSRLSRIAFGNDENAMLNIDQQTHA